MNAPTVKRYGADPLMFRSGRWVRGSGRSLSYLTLTNQSNLMSYLDYVVDPRYILID